MIRVFPAYRNGYSFRHGFDLYVGPWACHVNLSGIGVYGNGSRWFSGWYNWAKEDEWLYGKDL